MDLAGFGQLLGRLEKKERGRLRNQQPRQGPLRLVLECCQGGTDILQEDTDILQEDTDILQERAEMADQPCQNLEEGSEFWRSGNIKADLSCDTNILLWETLENIRFNKAINKPLDEGCWHHTVTWGGY